MICFMVYTAPADAAHARVHKSAGDRVVRHIAPAAEELQALVHHLALQFGGHQFQDRGIDRVQFVA
jgi:hypothetical protein